MASMLHGSALPSSRPAGFEPPASLFAVFAFLDATNRMAALSIAPARGGLPYRTSHPLPGSRGLITLLLCGCRAVG